MDIAAVIPARYGSTRFPGKPLVLISGKPMIQWVYEHADACVSINRVIVATDSQDIADVVEGFGGEVCMTSSEHETGTDRIAEVARRINADVIVNVQGDEPLLPPQAIAQAINPVLLDRSVQMCTLKTLIRNDHDLQDRNVVKVVTDIRDNALYFSRSLIPHGDASVASHQVYRHVGLYVYAQRFLDMFTKMHRTSLEKAESLEQLRALEHGYSIKVVKTDYYPVGVDVPEDIARVEKLLDKKPY
ncbi:MAG: 3-deoxy-manno-octulosonate cytidylyltransferase [Deltaproteobacteria bacterium]|nr:3-deoxy-manno-octulosonate cytidylyltransferase [Deltaproteobacteria bacterium]